MKTHARQTFPQLAMAAAVAGLMPIAGTDPGRAASMQVGVLNCTVSGGTGFIIDSTKSPARTFKHASGGRETYSGTIRKFGIDIGSTDISYISWAVLAPSGSSERRSSGTAISVNIRPGATEFLHIRR